MAQTFRFLDLPKELRLMVYERIPETNENLRFIDCYLLPFFNPDYELIFKYTSRDQILTITFVVQKVPNAILATCRFVNDEASSIITKRRKFPANSVPKIITHPVLLPGLVKRGGFLERITTWRNMLKHGIGNDLTSRTPGLAYSGGSLESLKPKKVVDFEDSCGRALHSDPEAAIEIALYGGDKYAKMDGPIGDFVVNTTGCIYNLNFVIGVAGPAHFWGDVDAQRKYEDQVTKTLISENRALDNMRAELPLPLGSSWPDFTRAERVEDLGLERWKADWGSGS